MQCIDFIWLEVKDLQKDLLSSLKLSGLNALKSALECFGNGVR